MKLFFQLVFVTSVVLSAAAADLSGHKLLITSVRTGERYWSNPERMRKVYAEKPADKRLVWIIRPDGSDAQVIEPLRYQMAIDGSRARWKPVR